jgi:hypothetical protein
MPLPASSLLFANALGPLFSQRGSHASIMMSPPPPCRRSAGEASSSSSSSSNRSSSRRRYSRLVVDAKASSTPPPPPPPNNARSFDGEDELDSLVSAELAQYIDPERAKQEQKRLELAWAVRAKVNLSGYSTRQGIGEIEGRFFFHSIFFFSLSPFFPSLFSPLSFFSPLQQNKTRERPPRPRATAAEAPGPAAASSAGAAALSLSAPRGSARSRTAAKSAPPAAGAGATPATPARGRGRGPRGSGPGAPWTID